MNVEETGYKYTVEDLARHFIVSHMTIRRSVKEGLPYIKIGNMYRFNLVEVTEFFQSKGKKWKK